MEKDMVDEQSMGLVSDRPSSERSSVRSASTRVPEPRSAGHLRSVATIGALVTGAGLLVLMLRLLVLSHPSSWGALRSRFGGTGGLMQKVEWVSTPPCGLMERDIEYTADASNQVATIGQYADIDYDTQCRHKCLLVAECQIWTWLTDKTCKLMSIQQHAAPQKTAKPGATSGGMPCKMDEMVFPGTLYCWALMQPSSYEHTLLADQYAKHISIFDCEEFMIISNQQIQVAPGLVTEVVQADLSCEKGGEFGTALNLDIFIAVWNRVVELGTYRHHDWTVKSDPDAIFFVDRLRGVLPHHPEEAKGVYLNNCAHGMHGPVEVFSRNAVEALNRNWETCQAHFTQLCGGDCKWGEDMFVDQCMQKVVGARRDNEWFLLVEDHCMQEGDSWSTAKCDGIHVAFHPFKDLTSYGECFSNAWHAAAQAQAAAYEPPQEATTQ